MRSRLTSAVTVSWPDWLHGPGGRLDPLVPITGAVAVAIGVLYLPGVVSSSARQEVVDYYLELILLGLVILAIRHGLAGVSKSAQRHFWDRLTAAFGFWLAADFLYATSPGAQLGPLLNVLADAFYVCFYLLLVLAVEQRAHLGARRSERFQLRRLEVAGTVVVLTGLLCYFVVIPVWLSRSEYQTNVPSFLLFVALDALLALRLLVMWRQSRGSRWRWVYGLLAGAMMLWMAADAMDGLYYAGVMTLESGTAADFVWIAAFLLVVLATRTRNREAGGMAAATHPVVVDGGRPGPPGLLIFYLLLLPSAHLAAYSMGLAEPDSRVARDVVVLLGLLALCGLALAHELTIRGRNRELRRRLEDLVAGEKLESVQRLESLGVLAGGIAHDFNNLLVSILGNADLVLRERQPDGATRQRVRQIRHAALQAADLAGQMLTYAGRGEFRLVPQNLNEVVAETGQLLESVISKKAELRFEWAPELPPVAVDAVQIRQLIMNLITNASEALEGGPGRIALATELVEVGRAELDRMQLGADLEAGRYVALSVSDTGKGMSERVLRRMFDPFFSTKFVGRGLGLAAVLGIVRSHGGALGVETEVGIGTTVWVLLPTAPDPVSPVVGRAATGEWPIEGTGTALVVEDEAEVRRVIESMLGLLGFEVILTTNGREGVAALRAYRERTTVVLLDLTMPVMDGAEALAEIQRLAPEVPVLIMSGYDDDSAHRRLAGVRPQAFLRKPFRFAELRDSLREMLDRQAGGR